MNFKEGDEVKNIKTGHLDIVIGVPGMPDYDMIPFRQATEGFISERHGWNYQKDWVKVRKSNNP